MSNPLIPGWCDRGAITLLAGASHAGKTTLLGQLLCGLSTVPSTWLGVPVQGHLTVAYVLAGDAKPWEDTAEVFHDLHAVVDPQRLSTSLEYPTHNPHTSIDLLLTALDHLPASDLYIIEGLTTFISPINVNHYHAPLQGLKELTRWAGRQHAAILGTHHVAKLDGGNKPRRPLDRVLGTTALVGNVSHCAVLETPEEIRLPTYRITVYHRRAKTQTLYLTRADRPAGPFELVVSKDPLREIFLAGIPHAPNTVHIKALYTLAPSEDKAKRWVDQLLDEGLIARGGRGTYSQL